METKLAIRTLNRFEKAGGLNLKCVKQQFGTEATRAADVLEWLIDIDINYLKPEIKKIVLMNDEKFSKYAWLAPIYLKRLDRQHCGKGLEYYLF